MARREVLVQLDDDLVRRLDELAGQLGTNRSELLRRGAQAVIAAEDLATAAGDFIAAYHRQPAVLRGASAGRALSSPPGAEGPAGGLGRGVLRWVTR